MMGKRTQIFAVVCGYPSLNPHDDSIAHEAIPRVGGQTKGEREKVKRKGSKDFWLCYGNDSVGSPLSSPNITTSND